MFSKIGRLGWVVFFGLGAVACGSADTQEGTGAEPVNPGGKTDFQETTNSLVLDRANHCARDYTTLDHPQASNVPGKWDIAEDKIVVTSVELLQTANFAACSHAVESSCMRDARCFWNDSSPAINRSDDPEAQPTHCAPRFISGSPVKVIWRVENYLDYALLDADTLMAETAEPTTDEPGYYSYLTEAGEQRARIAEFVLMGSSYARNVNGMNNYAFNLNGPTSGHGNISELSGQSELLGALSGVPETGSQHYVELAIPAATSEGPGRGTLSISFTPEGTLPNWTQLYGALVTPGSTADAPQPLADDDGNPVLADVFCENVVASNRRRMPVHGATSLHLYPRDYFYTPSTGR